MFPLNIVIFHSYVSHYQRVSHDDLGTHKHTVLWDTHHLRPWHSGKNENQSQKKLSKPCHPPKRLKTTPEKTWNNSAVLTLKRHKKTTFCCCAGHNWMTGAMDTHGICIWGTSVPGTGSHEHLADAAHTLPTAISALQFHAKHGKTMQNMANQWRSSLGR